ncbi:Esterase/lipase [Hahella chejuensis KCTC 2396]|uniref:Esterase/lipase n=1 Tax=Hahella chejuensis (strain KCTC 2396) TaxID=349521 RepID=Q2SPK1_HAHCH|nr:alpha/beta hydrolase [Hahella chejuensis]ABC27423.1 Esterase/lipase [Hahella chejuensis KCTC 2396]
MSRERNELFINHPVSMADLAVVDAIRQQSAPFKGMLNGPQARDSYNQMIEETPAAAGVEYQTDTVGGVPGVWVRVKNALSGAVILYFHGGGYVVGSANAYCHFAGQFAARVGVDVFIADYGLAPEHPFPTALNQAKSVYAGLLEAGYRQIAVAGDSAGGGLALSLAEQIGANESGALGLAPVCCVTMSPWTNLALTGASHTERAEEEFYLTRDAVAAFAEYYLAGHDAYDPKVSPLYGQHSGLPPLQIHVGTAEILLSDSLEYATRVQAAGAAVSAHVWEAMPHVFPNGFAQIDAAERAMQMMSEFLVSHF